MAQIPEVSGEITEQAALRHIEIKTGDGAPGGVGQRVHGPLHGLAAGRHAVRFVRRQEPLKFVQGRRQVIAGFDVGFEGMKVGGKRRIFIPYQLAYGEQQRGKIPPRSELIFDVELLDVKDASPNAVAAADLLFPFSASWSSTPSRWRRRFPRKSMAGGPRRACGRSARSACTSRTATSLMLNVSNGLTPR